MGKKDTESLGGVRLVYHFDCSNVVAVVQSLSHVWLSATPWTAAHVSLTFTITQSLLKLMSIESMMPSNHLTLCRPLLLPSILPSIRVFSNESPLCVRLPKYWSFMAPIITYKCLLYLNFFTVCSPTSFFNLSGILLIAWAFSWPKVAILFGSWFPLKFQRKRNYVNLR